MLKLLVEHEMVLLPGHPRNFLLILFVMLVIKKKSAAGAQAATHPSSKSAAIGKPAPGKHHPAAEPSAGVEKPAAAGAEKPAAAEPPPLLKMVATFDPYIAELDDGSDVLVPKHDVDVYIDRQKGIQVAELIGKFSENLLMGSHQKVK
jgi:hypothetical protein